MSGSFTVLRENESRLKDLVRQRFREAAGSGNQADVERFGRLFPLLNLHEEGLDLYAHHLRSKVCAYMCVCLRACIRACIRACVCVCVCAYVLVIILFSTY